MYTINERDELILEFFIDEFQIKNKIINYYLNANILPIIYFSFSFDGENYSFWEYLSSYKDLIKLNTYDIENKNNKLYLKIKFENITNFKINFDFQLIIEKEGTNEQIIYDNNNIKIIKNILNESEGDFLKLNNDNFNPYPINQLNKSIKLFSDILVGINNIYGIDVLYFKVLPEKESKDVIFKEWTLYNVDEPKKVKVLLPNNEIPETRINFTSLGITFEEPFEIEIIKRSFEEIFGENSAPQSRDIIYFKDIFPNRLYEIKSTLPMHDYMGRISYWKVDLMTYIPKSNTYMKEEIKEIFEDDLISSYKNFIEELEKETKEITKPHQYNRHLNMKYDDPIKYLNSGVLIKKFNDEDILKDNYISDYYYEFLEKDNIINYKLNSFENSESNFSLSLWIKYNNKENDDYNNINIIDYNQNTNIIRCNFNNNLNLSINDNIYLFRQNENYQLIGNIINFNNNIYEIKIKNDIINYINSIDNNWYNKNGWFIKKLDYIVLLSSKEENENTEYGWNIKLYRNKFLSLKFGLNEKIIILNNNIIEKINNNWFNLLFSYSGEFNQLKLSIFKIEDKNIEKILSLFFKDYKIEFKESKLEYYIIGNNSYNLSNIKLYNTIITEEYENNIITEEIINTFYDKLIFVDIPKPQINLPYHGKIR